MRPFLLLVLLITCACTAQPAPHFAGVFRCGPETVFDAWQWPDRLVLEMPAGTLALKPVPVASGVRHASDDVVFHAKGDEALLIRDGVQQACELDRTLMQALARGVTYRAVGQEPGWLLEVIAGESITFVRDYGAHTVTLPYAPARAVDGGQVIDAGDIEVRIRNMPCADAMSGQPYADTVSARQHERVFEGCGRTLPRAASRK